MKEKRLTVKYVAGKLTKTADNEWVFLTRYISKDGKCEIGGVRAYPITALDEEVVRYHADQLREIHNVEYRGEEMTAHLVEHWSTPGGDYSELNPSEKFKKYAVQKPFAKLVYQTNENQH